MKPKDLERLAQSLSRPDRPLFYLGDEAFGNETVHRFRLNNGLSILLLVDRSAPVVSMHTWFRVGSRHERQGKTGLAHLFEHLMFNETTHVKAGEFDRKLEENGAETNAATWVDWTYYYESVPQDRLPLVIQLESDRMANLVLRDKQVASEKEVVANERRYRVEDDVEGTASELLYKTAFERHPYHWPTIGWMDDILHFTPEDCQSFYRTYYAPNNACLVLVGDVRERDALRRLVDAYGSIPSAILPDEDSPPEPPQTSERRALIEKPTATAKLVIGYRGPAFGDTDYVALTALNEVLFGGRASRVFRAVMIDREIAADLRGWVATFKDPGLYEMHLTGRTDVAPETLLAALDDELAKVQDKVVEPQELERAVARFELGLYQALETTAGKAEQIGFHETLLGDIQAPFRRLDQMRRLTPSDLRRVARRYLDRSRRTIVTVLPEPRTAEAGEAA